MSLRYKAIPDSIAGLENLEEFNLSANLLESLPDSIGLLLKLKILDVSRNKLAALPDSISHCRSLEELDAGFNKLTYLPTIMGFELVNLKKLSVHLNRIRYLPTSIGELKSLRLLDIHFNELHGLPPSIRGLTSLEILNLSSNFNDLTELPDTISEVINLKELDLSNNKIHALPDNFGRLVNLTKLKLDENPLEIPPKEVVAAGVDAVRTYMIKRWDAILMEEEEKRKKEAEEQEEDDTLLARGTSWLNSMVSVVSGTVSGYLGGFGRSDADRHLNQEFQLHSFLCKEEGIEGLLFAAYLEGDFEFGFAVAMEASSTMVIKVKYGDMLRRFNAEIVEEDLNLSMDGLRKKILSLFSLAPDTQLMLTYIDEDGDVVTLVDNDDLHYVVKQALNPLRITIKKVPEPLRETLVKLSAHLASKASSSAPGVTELVDYLSKVSLYYLGQLSEDQPRANSSMQEDDVPESSTAARETNELFKVDPGTILKVLSNVRSELSSRNNESLEKLKPEVTMEREAGESVEKTSFGYNHMAALDSQNINVAEPGGDSSQKSELECPESDVASHSIGRKEKVKKITEFHVDGKTHLTIHQPPIANDVEKLANNTATGKDVNNPTQSTLTPNTAKLRASDHMGGDYVDDPRGRNMGPTLPQVCRGLKAKLDCRFIPDVNVFDAMEPTFVAPKTPFTKIWRIRNNGTAVWPQKTQLVWIDGIKLSKARSVELEIPAAGLLIDQELDVAVDFVSPEFPGRYISYWRMASPSGEKFGRCVWVLIQVDASVKEMPRESIRNLNLNLPPVSSCLTGPDNSRRIVELVQQNTTEQELKFPINDNLLVGNGASTSLPNSAGPSVSYPIIDLSDVGPALPSVLPAMLYQLPQPTSSAAPVPGANESAVDLPGKKQVEEKLLRELDEMGFKQVDLNKEVLRMNEYDLEQSMDDLCGVAEWDPILEELQEMGFHDIEMNKMLLKKNNGSIKRVGMDLIAGEKM
ncbi:UNVERIFIED_CONTAM: protein JOKA2 [Sesamum radiatum]|uniref:Protein JOKA2 n=1 Tax=Sesamum radiatum TaxID=300843 RepID=A0AAW2S078_SESRA